jgi:signal transduction histidine kinase
VLVRNMLDTADQKRARAQAFLRDAIDHLRTAGIDRAVIAEALRRLLAQQTNGSTVCR